MEFRVQSADDRQPRPYRGNYKVDGGVLTVTQETGDVTVYSPSHWQWVWHEGQESAYENRDVDMV